MNVEIILPGIVLGTLISLAQVGKQMLLVIVRPPAVCSAENRTMQHICRQILFSIFTLESVTEIGRMIMRFRDAIK